MTWVSAGATGLAALPSLGKFITGDKQVKKGESLLNTAIRPIYKKPGEVMDATAILADQFFNPRMPGAKNLVSQAGSATANAIDNAVQGATSSGDVLDAVTKIDYNSRQQINDIGAAEAEFANNAQQNYVNQLMNDAQYTDKQFDVNQMQPYVNQVARGQALIGAGNNNKFGGGSELSKLGAGLATSYMNNKLIFDPTTGKITK